MTAPPVKRGLVLSLGGTISLALRSGRAVPTDNTAELIARAGLSRDGWHWTPHPLRLKNSTDLDFGDVVEVARCVLDLRADHDAFIVTTGTDTLEEVAYGLALLLDEQVNLVVTGAMVPPYTDGFDGLANLMDASEICHGRAGAPVIVTIGGDRVSARNAVKLRNGSTRAFGCTLDLGGGNEMSRDSTRIALPSFGAAFPVIPVISATLGFDIGKIARGDMDGLVIACPGIASLGEQNIEYLAKTLTAQLPVVLSSRCFHAATEVDSYYPGYIDRLEALGFHVRGYAGLTPEKARIKLALSLM